MTSANLATPESYPRVELADRLLGDRIAIRSAALSNLTGYEYDKVCLERSMITDIRIKLYLVCWNLGETEKIIQQQYDALMKDNLRFR